MEFASYLPGQEPVSGGINVSQPYLLELKTTTVDGGTWAMVV